MFAAVAVLAATLAQAGSPEDEVFIHIDSDVPEIQLHRFLGTSVGTVYSGGRSGTVVVQQFATECTAPCDLKLSPGADQFLVGGGGATASDPFLLRSHGESVTLKVRAGRQWMRTLGATLLVTGLSLALTGGILYGVDALAGGSSGASNPYGGPPSLGTFGMWGLIGGGVAAAGGIPLVAFSGTKVEFLPGPQAPANGFRAKHNHTEI